MSKKKNQLLLAAVLVNALVSTSHADFKYLETADLRLLYFHPNLTYLAPYAARSLEASLASQQTRFEYTPSEPVTVLLMDLSDYGNASAIAIPRNRIFMQASPMHFTFETFSPGERIRTLANHELVHIVTMDQANSTDQRFRRLFRGKVTADTDHPETILYSFLTNPRFTAPSWYHEGSAVFMETWMAGGIGRAQGAYDEMVFRSMVRDDAPFYDPLGLVSKGTEVDFQTKTNSYLYGTRFMSYLAHQYSPEKLIEWLKRGAGSRRYYGTQFEQVFGKPLHTAWQDWIVWEHEFQHANLATIRDFETTPYRDVSKRALGSVSRAFVDPNSNVLYTAVRYPGVVGHLAAIDLGDGSIKQLQEIRLPMKFKVSSLAFDRETKTLFYTDDNSAFRDLQAYDTVTGESRLLLEDARIGDLTFNPADASLWGIRHLNGLVTIVRIPHPYAEWHQIHTFEFGEVMYDLDISSDGSLLVGSYGDVSGKQSLRLMSVESLLAGNPTPISSFDFGTAVPESFVFTADNKYLYGSSYYTGVSNIYRYEVATGDIQAVSNSETGFFRPVPLDDDSLLIFRYSGQGLVPAIIDPKPLEDLSATSFLGTKIANEHTIVQDWSAPSPADIDLDSMITQEGTYDSFKGLQTESVYPVVEGYKDSESLGFNAKFSDPLGLTNLSMTLGYSPDSALPADERIHAQMTLKHKFLTSRLTYNDADFYDLFGPTKKSRKGYSASVFYDKPILYLEPRLLNFKAGVALYGDLDTLPQFQNVPSTFDKLYSAELGFTFSNLRSSLGSVDDEKGYSWELLANFDYADSSFVPSLIGRFDVGFALPLAHSSIWLRNAAGIFSGPDDSPLSSIYFGGFGNNWVDNGKAKRYRDIVSFPGAELNDIAAGDFVKSMLEWNLPPLRFRRAGRPGFYGSWARPAIFAGVALANPQNDDPRRNIYDVGGQIDFPIKVLHQWSMMLSLGYAVAYENGSVLDREAMLSLKIL